MFVRCYVTSGFVEIGWTGGFITRAARRVNRHGWGTAGREAISSSLRRTVADSVKTCLTYRWTAPYMWTIGSTLPITTLRSIQVCAQTIVIWGLQCGELKQEYQTYSFYTSVINDNVQNMSTFEFMIMQYIASIYPAVWPIRVIRFRDHWLCLP